MDSLSNPTESVRPLIWHLWAKTDRADQQRWHALPYHHIEVGAVAHVLWIDIIPLARKMEWAERLGVDIDLAGRWLGFIAAIHDLGKVSIVFQSLVAEQCVRIACATGGALQIPTKVESKLRHGLVSASVLPEILTRRYGVSPLAARRYAIVTGGHHGVLATQQQLATAESEAKRSVGIGIWDEMRRELVDWLWQAFELPDDLPQTIKNTVLTYQEAVWLAGLISVTDWIGSDETHFTFKTAVATSPLCARCDAEETAREALRQAGWFYQPLDIPCATLTESFHFIKDPFPAQHIALDAIRRMSKPGIAVVEYPMGWGKTEIALWIAAYWAKHHGIPGFYIAMPTMTTSDQLHMRVRDHFTRHAKDAVNLQLLHGQAALRVDTKSASGAVQGMGNLSIQTEAAENPSIATAEATDDPEVHRDRALNNPVQRASWFTKRKRGLLATYGVGTVDQALMAILQSKHFFVRLHGLAGKTIIFDEVHAYDTYMSSLFDELLTWLGALGSPVVILTATLPQARTRQLIDAYNRGAGWSVAPTEIAAYPRITASDGTRMQSVSSPIDQAKSRSVALRSMPADVADDRAMWESIGATLDQRLQAGGTAALICNTVKQAQHAFQVLQRWFDPEKNELDLFHARFRQKERGEIQERVLNEFGKKTDRDGKRVRPRRKVVIATQVIEQSLDLDFDLMISMFCPTDLLLQRAGRLQRHPGTDALRPEGLRKPELWLAGFEESSSGPRFLPGSRAVYGHHVLLRSWLALREHTAIVIPDDVESLIEASYADQVKIPDELRDIWEKSKSAFLRKKDDDTLKAELAHIPKLESDRPQQLKDALVRLTHVGAEQDDDPTLHPDALARTRLGPPSVNAVILTAAEAESYQSAIDATTERLAFRDIRALLKRAVSLSDARVVHALRNQRIPPSWEATSFLRHHRLIMLDENNRAALDEGFSIELHPVLGVVFGSKEELMEEVDDQ
ncbi:MAG: CRISPR-associated helicase Cas3' [Thermomicrobiales bacterium]